MKPVFSNLGYIVLGAIVLSFWCLQNGFPFVYPDTGAYIFYGFDGKVPPDRPLTYGLFIRHMSMMESSMWVIFAQALLTSGFIYLFLKSLLPRFSSVIFLGVVLFLTLASDASLYVSYLMPDLFTPLAYGALGLLLFYPLPRRHIIALCLLAALSLMMHNSNLLGASLVSGFVLVWRLLSGDRLVVPVRRTISVMGLIAASWLGLCTLHYTYGGGFTSMNGRQMFIMARLNELGILKNYLDKACAENKNFRICACKDSIPDDFLWNPESPVNKTGGWEANKDEYNQIIGDIFSNPAYLKSFAIQTVNGAVCQLGRFDAEFPKAMLNGSPPYEAIRQKFPFERYTYSISRQNHSPQYLDTARRNARQQFFFFLSLMVGVLLAASGIWRKKVPVRVRQLYGFVAATLVVNAFVCSAFSTLLSRYQGRMIWLLFLVSIVAVFYRIDGIKLPTLGLKTASDDADQASGPPTD